MKEWSSYCGWTLFFLPLIETSEPHWIEWKLLEIFFKLTISFMSFFQPVQWKRENFLEITILSPHGYEFLDEIQEWSPLSAEYEVFPCILVNSRVSPIPVSYWLLPSLLCVQRWGGNMCGVSQCWIRGQEFFRNIHDKYFLFSDCPDDSESGNPSSCPPIQ